MKKIIFIILANLSAGMLLFTGEMSLAQTAVESTTTTTTAGTVSEFGPGALVIRSESSSEPIRYNYTKTTTYVDESGAPVSVESVKAGLPVTVYYEREGDQTVARKVVVRKSLKKTLLQAPATAVAGVVSVFNPDEIVVRSETAAEPIRYRYSKTTTYVDESGAPVSIETVRSGLPVTVYYDKEGSDLVARKVVVRRTATTVEPSDSTVIEHKKTTTTTKDND